ncbi:uncharacterized protein LKV04_021993 [Tautogolabrus adspersus]
MDTLQLSLAFLLLEMNFDPVTAQHVKFKIESVCQPCPQGYFVRQNCTILNRKSIGTQCGPCTNCSAADQETVIECLTFADSVCRNKSAAVVTPSCRSPEPTVSASDTRILLPIM